MKRACLMRNTRLGALFSRIPDTRIHVVLALVWVCLIVPTLLFWSNSILWILIISIYANIGAHFSAYEAAKNEGIDEETLCLMRDLITRLDSQQAALEKQSD